ncbi:transglutaminaseTgpA domain-containing protein [Comamonas sp. JC664]|uniref:transglutaminaseTgpA domain-containing protein n=1 Tax=Comamonas sp. JC664 TaxID=2801917 RepID=UPI00360B8207
MPSVFNPAHTSGASRWSSLPREARDTLFLLAVVGWILLPLTATLPLWASALAYALLAWRGRIALLQKPLPGRWQMLALLVLVVGLTLFSATAPSWRRCRRHAVSMLLTLKTMELRAKRDAMVIFFLGFFR